MYNIESAPREVTAHQLAELTATQLFMEADTNGDGKISFDEFFEWFNRDSAVGDEDGAELDGASAPRSRSMPSGDTGAITLTVMEYVKNTLKTDAFTIEEMSRAFQEV